MPHTLPRPGALVSVAEPTPEPEVVVLREVGFLPAARPGTGTHVLALGSCRGDVVSTGAGGTLQSCSRAPRPCQASVGCGNGAGTAETDAAGGERLRPLSWEVRGHQLLFVVRVSSSSEGSCPRWGLSRGLGDGEEAETP